MNKRGNVGPVLWLVIELLIGVSVAALLVFVFNEWGKGEFTRQKAIADDISLIIGKLQSSPAPTLVEYSKDLSRYTLQVKGSCVLISTSFKSAADIESCFPPDPSVLGGQFTHPEHLFIIKDGTGIFLSTQKKELIPSCPDKNYPGTIAIVPMFDGLNTPDIIALNKLRFGMETALGAKAISVMREPQNLESTEKLQKNADYTLELRVSGTDTILAYAPSELGVLACQLVNSVPAAVNIPGGSFILQIPQSRMPEPSLGRLLGEGMNHALS